MARRTKGIRQKRTRRTRRASTQKRRRTLRPTRRTQKRQRGGSGRQLALPPMEIVLPQEVGMLILTKLDAPSIQALRLVSQRIKEGVYSQFLDLIYQSIQARVSRWESSLATVKYISPMFINSREEAVFSKNISLLRQLQSPPYGTHAAVPAQFQRAAEQSQIETIKSGMVDPGMEDRLVEHSSRGLNRQPGVNDQQTMIQWEYARRATLALCRVSLHESPNVRDRMNQLYSYIHRIGEDHDLAMVIELMISDHVVTAVRKRHVNDYWRTCDMSYKIYTCDSLRPRPPVVTLQIEGGPTPEPVVTLQIEGGPTPEPVVIPENLQQYVNDTDEGVVDEDVGVVDEDVGVVDEGVHRVVRAQAPEYEQQLRTLMKNALDEYYVAALTAQPPVAQPPVAQPPVAQEDPPPPG